jgi:hypothetical protein
LGDPGRHGRVAHPEAADGFLFSGLSEAVANGRKSPDGGVEEAYVQGISTRPVDDLVKAMGISGISKSQVSRLCEEIDGKVKAFLDRPIEGDWPRVVSAFIATAFAQDIAETASTQWRAVADQIRSKVPKLATRHRQRDGS